MVSDGSLHMLQHISLHAGLPDVSSALHQTSACSTYKYISPKRTKTESHIYTVHDLQTHTHTNTEEQSLITNLLH